MFLADAVEQKGYLGLPFHRVYFTDGTVHQENLPDSRFKIPLGFRASYFLGDKFIIRTYYRYDLSAFSSNFFGAGFRIVPPKGVFGIQHLNMLELRYGHYIKNIGMNANIISMNLKFK